MPPRDDPVTRFYQTMHAADRDGLLATLADDFVGHVSKGLPDIGGTHVGAKTMLRRVWLPAFRTYGVLPHPEETFETTDGPVVVTGHYRGTPPATGRTFEAAFVHIFKVRDGLITELWQVTDSHRWVQAADSGSR